jgi:hypothetical protein
MPKVVNLDLDEDTIVLFSHSGQQYSYTKKSLIRGLGLGGKAPRDLRTTSQASLAKSLAWLNERIADGRVTDALAVRARLGEALSTFDGRVSANPSRIGNALAALAEHELGRSSIDLISQFLRKYPEFIEQVAERKDPKREKEREQILKQLREILNARIFEEYKSLQSRKPTK